MTHKFIINTENVNSYGYRILTSGIDFEQYMRNPVVLFMHNRSFEAKGNEVIGRCVRLYTENNNLVAEIEFDENDEFAKQIAGKVERGFIRMASLYADVVEMSADPAVVLPGQKYETITKCKLVEISIVDIGGNDDALKLSNGAGQPAQLKLLNQKSKNKMSEFKTIALALGKPADTSEEVLLQTINELKLAKDNAEAKTNEWKEKYVSLQKSEAEAIVNKAVSLGLVSEDLKDGVMLSFEKDHEAQKAKLSKLILDKEAENSKNQKQNTIAGAVNLAKGAAQLSNDGDGKDSYDYLQKHNPEELRRIHDEDPEKYAQLAADYGRGVRFVK